MTIKTLCLILLSLFFINKSIAQLGLNTTQTPQQLVNNVLLGGGVTAFNITFNGSPAAIGFFDGVNTNIGLDSGIVMTTGTVLNQGTNLGPAGINSDLMSFDNNTPGDADLTAIAGNNTQNATILEFDFIPVSDTVQFNYVFASEEYPGFCCGQYNDVFAFILNGVSTPLAPTNIALLPTTPPIPVSINNVNNGTTNNGPCVNCNFYINNTNSGLLPQNGQFVRFDAFTTVLTARANVICGETYHIKMAIADVFDGLFDSGVFLEAGSFDGGSFVVNSNIVGLVGSDSVLYRGCSEGEITVNRVSDPTLTDTIFISKTGSAVEGVDYVPFADSIIFQPGDTSFTINIEPLLGNPNDENLTIQFLSNTVCGGVAFQTIDIILQNPPDDLEVNLPADTMLCPQESINLTAIGSGGAYNQLFYTWNDSSTNTTQNFVFNNDTTLYVTVTDFCGINTASDTINITTNNSITASINLNDTTLCAGNNLFATASGGTSYFWFPNTGISSTTSPNVVLLPQQTTTYSVVASSGTCVDTATVTINVVPFPVITFDSVYPPVCFRDDSFELTTGQPAGGTYTGNGVFNNTFYPDSVNPNTIIITYTVDNQGCSRNSQFAITVNPIPNVSIDSLGIICNDDNEIALNIGLPSGGTYSGTGVFNNEFFPDSAGIGSHIITYTYEENNCFNSDSVAVNVEGTVADFTFTPETGVAPLEVQFNNTSSGNVINVWNFGDGTATDSSSSPSHTFDTPGEYVVQLTTVSDNNCFDTITKVILVEELFILVPNVFSPNGDGMNELFKPDIRGYNLVKADIYSRWGNIIYSWEGSNDGWDGKLNNNDATEGTYFYEFLIEDLDGERFIEKGYFNLFR